MVVYDFEVTKLGGIGQLGRFERSSHLGLESHWEIGFVVFCLALQHENMYVSRVDGWDGFDGYVFVMNQRNQ